MTEGTKSLLEDFLKITVDFLEADDGVIYGEVEKDRFEPVAIFSIKKDIRGVCFTLDDTSRENLLAFVINNWPEIFVTSDSTLIESLGIPYRERMPRSFMAVPFKVGSRRFLIAFSSDRLDVFPEKSQKIMLRAVKFLKLLLVRLVEVELANISKSKLNMLKHLIGLMLEESDPSLALYNIGEFLELDLVGLFYREGEEIGCVSMHTYGDIRPEDIKVAPRSLLYLAFERSEPYMILEEEEFVPDLKGYGFIIPYRGVGRKYVFVVMTKKEGYLTEELFDVFEILGRILVRLIDSNNFKDQVLAPSESFINRLRILANRSVKENIKILVVVVEIREFVRDISRRGFWEKERAFWEVYSAIKERFPKFNLYRLKDEVIVMVSTFESREMAKESAKSIKEFINGIEIVEMYNVSTFIIPDEVAQVDDLLSRLDGILRDEERKIQKKRFFI